MRAFDPEWAKKLLYAPVIARLVTLGELKSTYTLEDFLDLVLMFEQQVSELLGV